MRDRAIAWSISLLFEAVEFTFEGMLPNFKECWWDHFILDVLLCNGLGIEVGYWICKKLQMLNYNWIIAKGRCSVFENISSKFKPNVMERYEWKMFSSVRRFLLVAWFIFLTTALQTTGFFIKFLVWIPPPHYTLIIRVLVWAGMAAMASKDMYAFVDNKYSRFGVAIWISHVALLLEIGLIFKWGRGVLRPSFTPAIKLFWSSIVGAIILIAILISFRKEKDTCKNYNPLLPSVEVEID